MTFVFLDLTERVEFLEDVTLQMSGAISQLEDDITGLDQRVTDVELQFIHTTGMMGYLNAFW